MKIAILGTRGIPNNYGGFEQIAEKFSLYWVKKDHEVTVYNPIEHPYNKEEWKRVKIKKIFSFENKIGFLGLFLYDYLCLRDAIKNNYDIILNLGYAPAGMFFYLKKNTKAKFVTNMDGLDWKRNKWNSIAKKILLYCEKKAVQYSDALIADNKGIQEYLKKKFNVESYCIEYGANIFDNPNKKILKEFRLKEYEYYMLIARIEPENNIEVILDGYQMSKSKLPFIVVGDPNNKFGRYLQRKFKNNSNIKFVGKMYDYDKLSTLRWYARYYFHGHSVGGTNPSLLEAMASNAFIVAHNNIFNKYILEKNAIYFNNSKDISHIIQNYNSYNQYRDVFINRNKKEIKNYYKWDLMAEKYLKVFKDLLEK